jgi:hypothetical protein
MNMVKTTKNLDKKIYSHESLVGSAFLGGPLAFGYMCIRNYHVFRTYANNKEKKELLLRLIATFIPLVIITLAVLEGARIVSLSLLVLVITSLGFIWKNTIDSYLKHGGATFSTKNTFITLALTALIWIVGLIGIVYVSDDNFRQDFGLHSLKEVILPPTFDTETYNSLIEEYTVNEERAAEYAQSRPTTNEEQLQYLDKTVQVWQKNLELIDRLKQIDDLPDEYSEKVQLLGTYTELRIEEALALKLSVESPSAEHEQAVRTVQSALKNVYDELSPK